MILTETLITVESPRTFSTGNVIILCSSLIIFPKQYLNANYLHVSRNMSILIIQNVHLYKMYK